MQGRFVRQNHIRGAALAKKGPVLLAWRRLFPSRQEQFLSERGAGVLSASTREGGTRLRGCELTIRSRIETSDKHNVAHAMHCTGRA